METQVDGANEFVEHIEIGQSSAKGNDNTSCPFSFHYLIHVFPHDCSDIISCYNIVSKQIS